MLITFLSCDYHCSTFRICRVTQRRYDSLKLSEGHSGADIWLLSVSIKETTIYIHPTTFPGMLYLHIRIITQVSLGSQQQEERVESRNDLQLPSSIAPPCLTQVWDLRVLQTRKRSSFETSKRALWTTRRFPLSKSQEAGFVASCTTCTDHRCICSSSITIIFHHLCYPESSIPPPTTVLSREESASLNIAHLTRSQRRSCQNPRLR